MYCSLRFYIDTINTSICANSVLQVFDLFASCLGLCYNNITHILFSPDTDRMLINKCYLYDDAGKKEFVKSEIIPYIESNDGTVSVPFFEASCNSNGMSLYSKCRVQLQFPDKSHLMIIRVDYSHKYAKPMSMAKYKKIISCLCNLGFHINNSFFDVYALKNQAATLDGGMIGSFVGTRGNRNIDKWLEHQKHCLRDNLMDIFCANSIPKVIVSHEVVEAITSIVGQDNIVVDSDMIIFCLPNISNITPLYRVFSKRIISRLNRCFSNNNHIF